MLPLQRCREILQDFESPDEEIRRVRDSLRALAELVVDIQRSGILDGREISPEETDP